MSVEDALYEEQKWLAYQRADLFILPSHSENFGIVVAEALGMGLPVITTHATPWRVVEELGCGWSVPVGTEPLIAGLRTATETPPNV